MNRKTTLLICFVILLAGGGVTTVIFSTEPTATRSGATRETAMLVDVTEVKRGAYRPLIQVMGTVVPSQDITLSPRVGGEIIERSESFSPGGFVEEGEMLLQIDPSDYQNALQQRKSELQQALSDYTLEMGLQEAAQKEFQMYEDTLSEQNKSLILREPQLRSIKSRVEAAQAAVEQAELDLARTTVRAPFDAHILSRNVNVGSQVGPGDSLGRLVGLDNYWVEATVPLSKLRWLSFPGSSSEQGAEVRIRNRTAWPEGSSRTGYLYKLVGTLEEQTRMARVLISVPDPLGYQNENAGLPRMIIGSFVEANILGEELDSVIRLSRDYIRKNETVWVMENKQLGIRNVDIVFTDARYAYIAEGLTEQDRVVTTNLSTVVDGARLRLESSEQEPQPPKDIELEN